MNKISCHSLCFNKILLNLQSDSRFLVHNSTVRRALSRKWQGSSRRSEWDKTHEAGNGWERETGHRRRLLRRFIATIQTSNTWNPRGWWCNGRCPRDVFISITLYVNRPFTVVRAAVKHNLGVLYSYRRGLWVLKNRLKSVVRDLEICSCKQLKIRQESAKIES